MSQKLKGKRRKYTDEQVRKLREWKPFAVVCLELGIEKSYGRQLRNRIFHKQPSP